MTIRKLLTLILILLFVMNNNILAQDADTYLKELTTGKWRAKSPVNVVSMNDGERFAYIGNDRKQIIVDYYKTSKPQVLFDIDKHEKCFIATPPAPGIAGILVISELPSGSGTS